MGNSYFEVHLSMAGLKSNHKSLKLYTEMYVCIFPGCCVFNFHWSSKFSRATDLMWLFPTECMLYLPGKDIVMRIYLIFPPRCKITFYTFNNVSVILKGSGTVAALERFEWSRPKESWNSSSWYNFFFFWQSEEMLSLMGRIQIFKTVSWKWWGYLFMC